MAETMSDIPDGVAPHHDESGLPLVRLTIEVSGLKEVWEYPFLNSALQSALAAVEAVQMELKARQDLAQQLEKEFGEEL